MSVLGAVWSGRFFEAVVANTFWPDAIDLRKEFLCPRVHLHMYRHESLLKVCQKKGRLERSYRVGTLRVPAELSG